MVPLVALDPVRQLLRGLHRLIGTGLGLGVTALLLWADPRGLVLVLVVGHTFRRLSPSRPAD